MLSIGSNSLPAAGFGKLGEVDINTLNSSSLANIYQIAVGWKGGDLVKDVNELYPDLSTQ